MTRLQFIRVLLGATYAIVACIPGGMADELASSSYVPGSELAGLGLQPDESTANALSPAPFSSRVVTERLSKGSVAMRLPSDLLSMQFDQATGGEVFPPDQNLRIGSLTADESWRRQLDITLSPRTEGFGLAVTGGVFETRQPVFRGRDGSRRELGLLTDWRENRATDLDLKLDLADSRLRYAGGLAWAEYGAAMSSQLDQDARPRLDRHEGASQWHRLDADLWRTSDGSASVYGLYSMQDTAYRSLARSRPDTPDLLEGKTTELGGTLRHGKATLSLTHQNVTDGTSGAEETAGKLRLGALSFSLTAGEWTYFDDGPDGWWTQDEFWKGSVKLQLADLLGTDTAEGGALAGLLPDTVGLNARRDRIRSSSASDQPPDVRTKLGWGLGWIGEEGWTTDLFLYRTVTESPMAEAEELALDFLQSFFGNWWDVTAYASLSTQRSPDTSDRLYGGGVSFSITGNKYPKFSVGLDFNRFDMLLPDLDYAARDQEINLNATLDLSKYLPVTNLDHKPYLKLKAWGDWSLSSDSESGDETRLEPTALIVFGTRF